MIQFFKKIRDAYRSSVEIFLKKRPYEKWLNVAKIVIFSGRLIGVPIMDKKYKVYWYSWLTVFIAMSYFAAVFYTMWYYADEPLKALQSTVIAGIIIPVM